MIAQRTRRRGMRWTAFSADLRRHRSFWATWERGSYMGNCCWSASSLTFEELDDLCIFGEGLSDYHKEKEARDGHKVECFSKWWLLSYAKLLLRRCRYNQQLDLEKFNKWEEVRRPPCLTFEERPAAPRRWRVDDDLLRSNITPMPLRLSTLESFVRGFLLPFVNAPLKLHIPSIVGCPSWSNLHTRLATWSNWPSLFLHPSSNGKHFW